MCHSCGGFSRLIGNYAADETHYGKDVWVHRKGATRAGSNQLGIIPGSQGTKSFIVRGKGNAESFESCSHGAGRVMGRNEAVRKLNLEEERKKLESKGILHSLHTQRDLDEAASCYKDIHQVMDMQRDLVDIVISLEPMAVIKG
ncbi:MAG TPA: RtcB family protein [Bacteroidales bacterium]|nr:RtcB family protein [Bacteroidales bacterium]